MVALLLFENITMPRWEEEKEFSPSMSIEISTRACWAKASSSYFKIDHWKTSLVTELSCSAFGRRMTIKGDTARILFYLEAVALTNIADGPSGSRSGLVARIAFCWVYHSFEWRSQRRACLTRALTAELFRITNGLSEGTLPCVILSAVAHSEENEGLRYCETISATFTNKCNRPRMLMMV